MKVTLKLVVATIIGTLVVDLSVGLVRVRRELTSFDESMRKNHELIGATLGVCVSNSWRTAGQAWALKLIEEMDRRIPDLKIGWIYADGRRVSRTPTISSAASNAKQRSTHSVYTDSVAPERSQLVTLVPVHSQNRFLGDIEIAEGLITRDRNFPARIRQMVRMAWPTLLVSATVFLLAAFWIVGRPLQLLTRKARQIRRGDFASPVSIGQRDEFGELAAGFNAMCHSVAEWDKQRSEETLAQRAATQQLRHLDRLVTVGRFAAGVADQLATPLSTTSSRLCVLIQGGLEYHVIQSYHHEIRHQLEAITRIIRQFVEFAQPREPQVMTVELTSLAQSIAKLAEPFAAKKHVQMGARGMDQLLARGDSMQLEQMFLNLVVNAIEACGEGGHVEITCGTATMESENSVGVELKVFVRVTDDGCGMTPDVQQRIFDPFFTTRAVGHSAGLGLSVAQGIVEAHGGSIEVVSVLGQGSTFTVYLPKAQL